MRKTYFTPEESQKIIRLYRDEHIGLANIGKLFGVSRTAIKKELTIHGIDLDPSGQKYRGGKSAADKRYAAKHKTEIAEYNTKWQKENRAKLRNYHKKWRDENREQLRRHQREWTKNRYNTDPMYRLNNNIRYGVWASLKERGIVKGGHTFEMLGYTQDQLKSRLESQFTEGMTWENYGEWHVDHKRPISSFDFHSHKDPEFQQCWALDNLQPMWGEENWSKGSKI